MTAIAAGVTPVTLNERAAQFAGGLAGTGVRRGDRMAILCCEEHQADFRVAYGALFRLGATPVIPPEGSEAAVIALRSVELRGAVACRERSDEWAASSRHGLFVGHLPYGWWWPLVERRQRPIPSLRRAGAEIADIRLHIEGGILTEHVRTVAEMLASYASTSGAPRQAATPPGSALTGRTS